MPQSADYFCHMCLEFISDRKAPSYVTITVDVPGDMQGTKYAPDDVPPLVAAIRTMKTPAFDACAECMFTGTPVAGDGRDENGVLFRNGPPLLRVDMTLPQLRAALDIGGASAEYPGETTQAVAIVRSLGADNPIAMEERWRSTRDRIFGEPSAELLAEVTPVEVVVPPQPAEPEVAETPPSEANSENQDNPISQGI